MVLIQVILFGALCAIIVDVVINNKSKDDSDMSEDKYQKYPTGLELLSELREISIPDIDIWKYDTFLINPAIFREYVYNYEFMGGYTREVALKMAFKKYIGIYNI